MEDTKPVEPIGGIKMHYVDCIKSIKWTALLPLEYMRPPVFATVIETIPYYIRSTLGVG